jgi:uncharacterized protein (UPF0261 family)
LKHPPTALLVATMDTKGQEALFLAECLKKQQITVKILDAGIKGKSPVAVDITREEVAKAAGKSLSEVRKIGHEGKALQVMTEGAVKCATRLHRQNEIHGIIGLGGSMGTTLGSGVMRALPIGFPKLMISTMASRDTRPFVGSHDILMLHSVCDLAGINRITGLILRNGALAMAGMLKNAEVIYPANKPLVLLSNLGTTEACSSRVRQRLEEKGNEVIIFHTVGSGGAAMEEIIRHVKVDAVVDLSLNEIGDHRFGGEYDAGPGRGTAALQKGIPTIMVPGNMDFFGGGTFDLAQKRFPNRTYHRHNAAITAVRTELQEVKEMAAILAERCNAASGPLVILIPQGGFSAFDRSGGPFYKPRAPEIFAQTFKKKLKERIPLHILPFHINDPEFAQALIQAFETMVH